MVDVAKTVASAPSGSLRARTALVQLQKIPHHHAYPFRLLSLHFCSLTSFHTTSNLPERFPLLIRELVDAPLRCKSANVSYLLPPPVTRCATSASNLASPSVYHSLRSAMSSFLPPSDSEDTDSLASLPDSASSDSIDSDDDRLRDAEREWKESVRQIELLLTMILVPAAGKYLGRKCAFWSTYDQPIHLSRSRQHILR